MGGGNPGVAKNQLGFPFFIQGSMADHIRKLCPGRLAGYRQAVALNLGHIRIIGNRPDLWQLAAPLAGRHD
jgi:hypothetical protein